MKKLAEIVCALILFAYPVSAYAEASTEPWSTPLQTTAFIIPGMRYSLLLPPIEAYRFGAFREGTSRGYSFIGNTFPAADTGKPIYVAMIYKRYPPDAEDMRQYLAEHVDAYVQKILKTNPVHVAQDTSLEKDYFPARWIRITNRREAGIGACRDILCIANYNGLWYIDIMYIANTEAQKSCIEAIISSIKSDWSDEKAAMRFEGFQPIKDFEL